MAQLQATTLTVTPTVGDDWVNLPINPENIVRAYSESVQINGVDLNLYPAIHFDLVTGAIQYWIYGLGDTATRDADLALVDAAIGGGGLTAPVTNADLADMSPWTIKMRNDAAAGDPQDVKISSLTDSTGFGSGDKLMIEESTGELRKIDFDDIPTGSSLATKSGIVAFGAFSGNPKKAAVVFSAAFSDNLYSITVTGEDSRNWTIEGKSAAGFTINANSNSGLSANTFWQAIKSGES